jgi:RHS repeat-associated protein
VKRVAQGAQVEYVLDDKFVLSEHDGSNTAHSMKRRYHYGAQPLAESEVAGASRFTTWLNTDAQGSLTDATQSDGTVRTVRQYDAWGNYQNGSAPAAGDPKLGYTGHQFDPETGLTYARARYYDSELGIFLSRDPKDAGISDAPWLRRYVYARDNPVLFIDVDGLCDTLPDGRKDCVSADVEQTGILNWQIGRAWDEGNYASLPGLLVERGAQSFANQGGRMAQVFIDPQNQVILSKDAFSRGETQEGFKRVGGVVGATLKAAAVAISFGWLARSLGPVVGADEVVATEASAARRSVQGTPQATKPAAPSNPVELEYKPHGDPQEFMRQVAGQERGLNKMTAGQIKSNLDRFRTMGRPSTSESALSEAQQQELAASQGQKVALHEPDLCIGGENCVSDVGGRSENSSIGAQNRFKQQEVYDSVKDLPPDSRVDFRLKVKQPEITPLSKQPAADEKPYGQ